MRSLYHATIVIILLCLFTETGNSQNFLLYCNPSANSTIADGSMTNPFSSIQQAIKSAEDNSEIVLLPGIYKGAQNKNLIFYGKNLTLRGLKTEDKDCIKQTIVDGEGQGIIADCTTAGDRLKFEGISFVLGDTSNVEGYNIPGMFKISLYNIPISKNINIIDCLKFPIFNFHKKKTHITEVWDTIKNPDFLYPPFETTDYYGSGDVNNDGDINQNDLTDFDRLVVDQNLWNIRSDVNGDGVLNISDRMLIESAILGDNLPGWWNYLTKKEREEWVTKVTNLDIDLHPHPYQDPNHIDDRYTCGSFSIQSLIHQYGSPIYYHRNYIYNGGKTIYNLPFAYAGAGLHAFNGVLIGNDPKNFNDWIFPEPQVKDYFHTPGSTYLPYGSGIGVKIPGFYHIYGWFPPKDYGATGWGCSWGWMITLDSIYSTGSSTVYQHAYDSIRQENPPQNLNVYNEPWRRINIPLAIDQVPHVVYEQMKDDLKRFSSIFIRNIKTNKETELVGLNSPCYILDAVVDQDGYLDLFFKSEIEYHGRLLFQRFDRNFNKIFSEPLLLPENRWDSNVTLGKCIQAGRFIYFFWLGHKDDGSENNGYMDRYDTEWNVFLGKSSLGFNWEDRLWDRRLLLPFDVTINDKNNPVLFYVNNGALKFKTYNRSQWDESKWILGNQNIREVKVTRDHTGTYHIVCCQTNGDIAVYEGNPTTLRYARSKDLLSWDQSYIDQSDDLPWAANLLKLSNGNVLLTYEKLYNGNVKTAVRMLDENGWGGSIFMDTISSCLSISPRLIEYKDDSILCCWTEYNYYRGITYQTKSFSQELFSTSSIENRSSNKTQISLYPNPVKFILNISIEANNHNFQHKRLIIYDSQGRRVKEKPLVLNRKDYTMDVSELGVGLYYIRYGNCMYKFIHQ